MASNSLRTFLISVFPLLGLIIAGSVVISLDNHFVISLNNPFTQRGTSDVNNFGIILSNQPVASNLTLDQLGYYKKVVVPYNQSSGELSVDVTEPMTNRVIGFYDEHTNHTNSTTMAFRSHVFSETENITALYNQTDTNIIYQTSTREISDSVMSLGNGIINGTKQDTNMSFYPAPPIVWEDIYTGIEWYETWYPNASLINKTFTRIYIPFKGIPSSSGLVYVQIYNASESISVVTLHNTNFYSSSYSVINILESDDPFVYYGGVIQIKVWTNPNINWWAPIQVATQTPMSTNSTMIDINTLIFGFPITTTHPNTCFFKGWILEQSFTSSGIFSESNKITMNFSINLQDIGVSVFNILNFSVKIDNVVYNISTSHFIQNNISLYNEGSSKFDKLGNLTNSTYGIYNSTITNYINSNNQILLQFALQSDAPFIVFLNNITYSVGFYTTLVNTTYYTTYTLNYSNEFENILSSVSTFNYTPLGYIYNATITQIIHINSTIILSTSYRVLTENVTWDIVQTINQYIMYYLYNPSTGTSFDIGFNYFQPSIIVGIYDGTQDQRVIISDTSVLVYF